MPGGDGLLRDRGRLVVVQGNPAQLTFLKLRHGTGDAQAHPDQRQAPRARRRSRGRGPVSRRQRRLRDQPAAVHGRRAAAIASSATEAPRAAAPQGRPRWGPAGAAAFRRLGRRQAGRRAGRLLLPRLVQLVLRVPEADRADQQQQDEDDRAVRAASTPAVSCVRWIRSDVVHSETIAGTMMSAPRVIASTELPGFWPRSGVRGRGRSRASRG